MLNHQNLYDQILKKFSLFPQFNIRYGDVAGAAVTGGRTPPCIEFNRRDAKVSLSIPGRRERKNERERRIEREVGVEDKEMRKGMSSWCPLCLLLSGDVSRWERGHLCSLFFACQLANGRLLCLGLHAEAEQSHLDAAKLRL